ncbi:MAG: 4-(cytidine 5'-diphospho)-2-C-methyl-D-erythritol kinase [Chloroflexota bacterium]|nr:4-(cytidine 5'-diphospho)-2-C-methyl-D-erythritol kinase [Chloroflexota bacterium]
MSRARRLLAPAKVNLTLEVVGPRADGYHELRSIFATIDLADRVRVAASNRFDIAVRPDPLAPPGEELTARAARALAAATGHPATAHIRVDKRIPLSAGLGGGSSDAGTALRGLATIWRTDSEVQTVGAGVGSDVPFFAAGVRFALVEGRGERVRELSAPANPIWIVLVRVAARVATRDVFDALRRDEWSHGRATADLARAFDSGSVDPDTIRSQMRNDLLGAATRVCRDIGEARLIAGSKGVTLSLSGSGPALFCIADSRADALRLARILRGAGLDARSHELGPVEARGIRASDVPLRSSGEREA